MANLSMSQVSPPQDYWGSLLNQLPLSPPIRKLIRFGVIAGTKLKTIVSLWCNEDLTQVVRGFVNLLHIDLEEHD